MLVRQFQHFIQVSRTSDTSKRCRTRLDVSLQFETTGLYTLDFFAIVQHKATVKEKCEWLSKDFQKFKVCGMHLY